MRRLFRTFAQLEPTTSAILEFANQYGMLWNDAIGIPFGEWEYELRVLRFLIDIWEAADKSPTPWLRKQFPEKNGRFECPFADTVLLYADYQTGAAESIEFKPPDSNLQETARDYALRATSA
jgi:hypothetical protein